MISLICLKEEESQRLDRYLKRKLENINQAFIEKNIRKKLILVNKTKTSSSYRVLENDVIEVLISVEENFGKTKSTNNEKKEKFIIFEDDDFCVINKPPGLASQLGTKTTESVDTLFPDYKLVHRLDKDTSGIMLLAKTLKAAWFFQEKFKNKEINKKYLAVVHGIILSDFGTINEPLLKNDQKVIVCSDGLESITKYKVIQRSKDMTLVEFFPLTGRTHQIRVHTSHIGHPIVGDSKYDYKGKTSKLHLHALEITWLHFNKNRLTFNAQRPEHIQRTLYEVF